MKWLQRMFQLFFTEKYILSMHIVGVSRIKSYNFHPPYRHLQIISAPSQQPDTNRKPLIYEHKLLMAYGYTNSLSCWKNTKKLCTFQEIQVFKKFFIFISLKALFFFLFFKFFLSVTTCLLSVNCFQNDVGNYKRDRLQILLPLLSEFKQIS